MRMCKSLYFRILVMCEHSLLFKFFHGIKHPLFSLLKMQGQILNLFEFGLLKLVEFEVEFVDKLVSIRIIEVLLLGQLLHGLVQPQ